MKYLVVYSAETTDTFANGRAVVITPTPLNTEKAILELEKELIKNTPIFVKLFISNIIPLKG